MYQNRKYPCISIYIYKYILMIAFDCIHNSQCRSAGWGYQSPSPEVVLSSSDFPGFSMKPSSDQGVPPWPWTPQ